MKKTRREGPKKYPTAAERKQQDRPDKQSVADFLAAEGKIIQCPTEPLPESEDLIRVKYQGGRRRGNWR